ncbi:MAG: glycosyltransferase [Lachnospiraceae bacterium]|nr:glycosyltransferase [Lachnospiraceae bacterium]
MKILFHQYGSICEPDIISIFEASGIQVVREDAEVTQKSIPAQQRVRMISDYLFNDKFTFVFSINFFPYISDICERFQIPYVCLSVDCPVLELFSESVKNKWNRIFLFDYTQYMRFVSANPDCIFYLPLATNADRWDQVISSMTPEEYDTYTSDISFVGSLYTEKSPLSAKTLPPRLAGYVDGAVEAQLQVYGYNFLEEIITPELTAQLKKTFQDYRNLTSVYPGTDNYTAANYYLAMRAAELERIRTLQALSHDFHVDIYTRSSCKDLTPGSNLRLKGGVSTLTEMPKVFHCSKINLNITIKSIQSGLSLRIWDVLGCGGFLLSNYQTEIPEYFEIGKDLVCYESIEDLKEKAAYYLTHDDIRMEIARNGYEKVKAQHTWAHRISSMMQTILATLS